MGHSKALFLGHLGLGDHIVLQGAVNILSPRFDEFIIPCKPHSKSTLEVLMEQNNLKNITIVSLEGDDGTQPVTDMHGQSLPRSWINTKIGYYDQMARDMVDNFEGDIIRSGVFDSQSWRKLFRKYKNSYKMNAGITFDRTFYRQLGLRHPDTFNWWCRAGSKSDFITEQLKPNEPYIFVHDDPSRGYFINRELLPRGIKIVSPTIHSESIFDYLPLMREAEELHFIDSSFALMWDRYQKSRSSENYIHRYIRHKSANPYYTKGGIWHYFGGPVHRNIR